MMLRYSLAGTQRRGARNLRVRFPPAGGRLAMLEAATRTIATLWNAEEPAR